MEIGKIHQWATVLPILLYFSLFLPMEVSGQSQSAPVSQDDSIEISNMLDCVEVTANRQHRQALQNTLPVVVVDVQSISQNSGGTLMNMLQKLPGIQSMSIGAGSSKPMIRGMAFNRVAFIENGIKQESQQWGADHGLEFDPYKADQIIVRKGPSSLLYGSDAMGGVIEVLPQRVPMEEGWRGGVYLNGQSYNMGLTGGGYTQVKRGGHFASLRLTSKMSGDLYLPTQEIHYLTRRIPIEKGILKNTATRSQAIDLAWHYHQGAYHSHLTVSDIFRKEGFFPGAHGLPDLSRLSPDGNRFDIHLPYNRTNHFQTTWTQNWYNSDWNLSAIAGYQYNLRQEWSSFHTHYPKQKRPSKDPDKELQFDLHSYDLILKSNWSPEPTYGIKTMLHGRWQQNEIGGYSFLMPQYNKQGYGIALTGHYSFLEDQWRIEGGMRADWEQCKIKSNQDEHLFRYLVEAGYSKEEALLYGQRSRAINRLFSDLSGGIGIVYRPGKKSVWKFNIGHSFRVPTPIELAANGVHHGTFRHEQGDPSLNSEKGWQVDLEYLFSSPMLEVSCSPYGNYFSNYIYLSPSGEWSLLPHSGQIYRFVQNQAFIAGIEASLTWRPFSNWKYNLGADATYTYNIDEGLPLPFSPPVRLQQTLSYTIKDCELGCTHRWIATQHRTARNEESTPGTHLFDLSASYIWNKEKKSPIQLGLSIENLFNRKYYNHLSFYRKVELPEPGINIQFNISFTFN